MWKTETVQGICHYEARRLHVWIFKMYQITTLWWLNATQRHSFFHLHSNVVLAPLDVCSTWLDAVIFNIITCWWIVIRVLHQSDVFMICWCCCCSVYGIIPRSEVSVVKIICFHTLMYFEDKSNLSTCPCIILYHLILICIQPFLCLLLFQFSGGRNLPVKMAHSVPCKFL